MTEPRRGHSPSVVPSGAGFVGLLLRHRKPLMVGYLILLHALVYYSLTHGLFNALTHRTIQAGPCLPQPSSM
eukprot:1886375-Pyramimonas_sp.AAC.1